MSVVGGQPKRVPVIKQQNTLNALCESPITTRKLLSNSSHRDTDEALHRGPYHQATLASTLC